MIDVKGGKIYSVGLSMILYMTAFSAKLFLHSIADSSKLLEFTELAVMSETFVSFIPDLQTSACYFF